MRRRVGNVLKRVLPATAVAAFGLLAWATDVTYRTAPPRPARFPSVGGSVLLILGAMHQHDLIKRAGGFRYDLDYARSLEFYDTTLLWHWLRFVGDIPFAVAALIMAYDFLAKLAPLLPSLGRRAAGVAPRLP